MQVTAWCSASQKEERAGGVEDEAFQKKAGYMDEPARAEQKTPKSVSWRCTRVFQQSRGTVDIRVLRLPKVK